MKRTGQSRRAAWRLIFWTLVLLLALWAAGVTAVFVSKLIVAISGAFYAVGMVLAAGWLAFSLGTLYLFRDPNPICPSIPNAIVAPAHGKVVGISEGIEPDYLRGDCQRISISISLWDVHVQKAPISGRIAHLKHTPAQSKRADRVKGAATRETLSLGINPAEFPGQKIMVRLVAGFWARRIQAFVAEGERVERSERIGLIRYGSRCELCLPAGVKVHVKLGERVKGGESIVASFD